MPDYYLQIDQTQIQDTLDVEPYPKPGAPNPIVDLFVYDVATKKTTQVDVRDGKPFDERRRRPLRLPRLAGRPTGRSCSSTAPTAGRTSLEFAAADPADGQVPRRSSARSGRPSWVENRPTMRFLKDGKRFIWASERTGCEELLPLRSVGQAARDRDEPPVRRGRASSRVDERRRRSYYMARDGDNPMKLQLHRVGLDGKGDKRLTDPAFNHTVHVRPDGQALHRRRPDARHAAGHAAAWTPTARSSRSWRKSDTSKFDAARTCKKAELLTFKAADGKTQLHGLLHFPSNFDPTKKYPLLVTVYGGPTTNAARETFTTPNAADRVRLPRRVVRLAQRRRARQADASTRST